MRLATLQAMCRAQRGNHSPCAARAKWVQQMSLADEVLDRRELEPLLRAWYDLVAAKLPKSTRPALFR